MLKDINENTATTNMYEFIQGKEILITPIRYSPNI
jgi:hypothetical protein